MKWAFLKNVIFIDYNDNSLVSVYHVHKNADLISCNCEHIKDQYKIDTPLFPETLGQMVRL